MTNSLPERADYSHALEDVSQWHTAVDVPPSDMNRLTHQLRYQAEKLGLNIHIETNKEASTVSFKTTRKKGP